MSNKYPKTTTADLQREQLAKMETDGLTAMAQQAEREAQALEKEIARKAELAAKQGKSQSEVEVVHDPWAGKDPLQIKEHPDEWRLRWVNPAYRSHRGWKGWIPVRWSEPLGQEIASGRYLADVPPRLAGTFAGMDDFIRLGADCILAKLSIAVWQARKASLAAKNRMFIKEAASKGNSRLDKYVTTFGEGMTVDNPYANPVNEDADMRNVVIGTNMRYPK